MKALNYQGKWHIELTEKPVPTCSNSNDVVVRIACCGICGTDIGIISGAYPVAVSNTTLGHETAGTVVEVGPDVHTLKVGDRVVVNPTYSCHKCRMCLTGNFNHCESKHGTEAGVSYDGAFADYYLTQEASLLRLADNVSFEEATLTEPLSCTLTGIDKLNITATRLRAVVIGAGPMGMLYVWALHTRNINCILIENNDSRFEFASTALPPGATLYKNFLEAIEAEYGTQEEKIDLCVDTTGHMAGVAIACLAPGGKILNIALKPTTTEVDLLQIADKSLTVMGSIDSLNNSFHRAYDLIQQQAIPVKKLISHSFPIEHYKEAFLTVGCDLNAQQLTAPTVPTCKVLITL